MNLKLGALAVGGAVVVGGGAMQMQSNDLTENYKPTQAVITEMEVDCYLENRKAKLESKSTGEMSYVDCNLAPLFAVKFDFDEKDIKQRVTAVYQYRSHVDGKTYEGAFTRQGRDRAEDFALGETVPVFAHNQKPEDSRTISGNVFVEKDLQI